MSNIARCDLNNNIILTLLDYRPNPRCNCQKQITFTPIQFQPEGAGFKNPVRKLFERTEKMGNIFIKPG